ncbi:MAG: hypothetical protein LBC99_02525 [Spirochaetota bacterium]|nr:hypothetical protein [Spirochaetota bacterium]
MASCLLMNERSVHALRTRRHNLEYIKTALLKMAPLLGSVEDRAAKKKMEKLYDEIQSSPVQSSAVLEQTETNILLSIGMLGNAVSTGDTERILSLTDSLLLAVSERNNTLKMLN